MKIEQQTFGFIQEKEVCLFTLSHDSGATIKLSNYGATWVSAMFPDKHGEFADVVLGYNNLEGYLTDTNYIGSTVGRFANRINQARFTLGKQLYYLDKNDGENTNHGGFSGVNSQVFDYELTDDGVVFLLESPEGNGGFPGNVNLKVCYSFSDDFKVIIKFQATTDKDTYLNLTNHSYFNLAGTGSILNHQLQIPSTQILETTECFIPTGRLIRVQETVFDFTQMRTLDEKMDKDNKQLIWNRGYNHCYPIDQTPEQRQFQPAATLFDPESGRRLQLFTTLPSVLVYSAGFLKSKLPGKSGLNYQPNDGICLEAQFYPDSPNHAHFPSCLLREDEIFDQRIEFHFDAIKND
ncbi:MAG: aldose epimerase family protein [Bacteroidota bacterium]|nr:aldose epimerase family protein [Bacteroidota bacterium]